MPAKKSPDPFAEVRTQTLRHRAQHGCGAYPFEDGAILGVIAAAVAAKRVLELGCALGYTALWFAHGAKDATIDTIEFDPVHARLARENFAALGVANRVSVHQGDFAEVLPGLAPDTISLSSMDSPPRRTTCARSRNSSVRAVC